MIDLSSDSEEDEQQQEERSSSNGPSAVAVELPALKPEELDDPEGRDAKNRQRPA